MAPQKSDVWKHALKIDKTHAKCKMCQRTVAYNGNTTNLWNHLKAHKIFKTSSSSSHLGEASNREEIDDPKEGEALPLAESPPYKRPCPPSDPLTLEQAFDRSTSFKTGGSRSKEINDAVAYMICKDHLPLCASERPGFRYLLKKVVPLWQPPSRKTITTLIEEKYDFLRKITKKTLSDANNIVLTTDCWTNTMTSTSFIGVTTHFLRKDGSGMESATIGVEQLDESHTSLYLKTKLEEICEDWNIGLDRVSICVTDNGSNIVKAVKDTFGTTKHFGCFAHTLNLLAMDCFAVKTITGTDGPKPVESVPGLNFLVKMVKTVVIFCKSSNNTADEIRRLQYANGKTAGTALRPILDVATRWNSTHDMIVRFLEMTQIITLALIENPKSPPMPNAKQVQSLKTIAKLLAPLHQATVDISAERIPTASKVIPLLHITKEGISKVEVDICDNVSKALKEKLLEGLQTRFGNYEQMKPLAKATLVDPRFKRIHFERADSCAAAITDIGNEVWDEIQKSQAEMRAQIEETANRESEQASSDDIWAIHDALADKNTSDQDYRTLQRSGLPDELKKFLQQKTVNRMTCPFQTWGLLKAEFPHLFKVAMKHLPVLASSVPTERLFSQAGIIMTDLRNRLSGEHLKKLLFLSSLSSEQWEEK